MPFLRLIISNGSRKSGGRYIYCNQQPLLKVASDEEPVEERCRLRCATSSPVLVMVYRLRMTNALDKSGSDTLRFTEVHCAGLLGFNTARWRERGTLGR
jgi:hypothetical protein